jgi:hypothetical protein
MTLTRMKEGTDHAMQKEDTDAQRQAKDLGKTKRKPMRKGKQRNTEWKKSKGRTRRVKTRKKGQERGREQGRLRMPEEVTAAIGCLRRGW